MKNPFAYDSKGRVVHVQDATPSHAPFTCPGCSGAIELRGRSVMYRRSNSRKDIQNRGHFVHVRGQECTTGLETSLHQWAKLIIEEAMDVGLPPHVVMHRSLEEEFDTHWTFRNVILEEWQDGVRPDIVMEHDDGRLNVEIRVTHAVDAGKTQILRDRAQSCIEINLSKYDFERMPGEDIRQAILSTAPRRWLCHQLDEERTEILRSQWNEMIDEKATDLLDRIRRNGFSTEQTICSKCRSATDLMGTTPFIGIPGPYDHWFKESPFHWQHTILMAYLGTTLDDVRNTPNPISSYPYYKGDYSRLVNPDLKEEPEEILHASGLTKEQYGSPMHAIMHYLSMLCRMPDREGVHPAARRLISFGETEDVMEVNPAWAGYISRRSILNQRFLAASKRAKKNPVGWSEWSRTPLGKRRLTPLKMSLEGGRSYIALLAHLRAIENMLAGGWPVDHLLGIEEEWLRDKRRTTYDRSYSSGGGCHPFGPKDVYRTCPSSKMMRDGDCISEIMTAMSHRTHPGPASAAEFLEKPRLDLEGLTPKEVARDVPTMQYCIGLMPVDPSRSRYYGGPLKRIW